MTPKSEPKPELFYLYRRGLPLNVYSERSIIDGWLKNAPWLYPPDECEVVRYVLADGMANVGALGEVGRKSRLRRFLASLRGCLT